MVQYRYLARYDTMLFGLVARSSYFAGTIPAQIIQLEHIRPSIWIPSCEIFWSILVIGMGFAKNVETLYALRFLVGFAEACVFPGFAAMLGKTYHGLLLEPQANEDHRRLVWANTTC